MALDIISNGNFVLIGAQLGLVLLQALLFLCSLFLMLLVLVQRGKGGGLTGALGGQGGQSAFGSKAGDAFTKITIITSMVWIMLCMVTIAAFNPPPVAKTAEEKRKSRGIGAATDTAPESGAKAESKTDGESKAGGEASAETKGEGSDAETKTGDGVELNLGGESDTPTATLPGGDADSSAEATSPEGGVTLDLDPAKTDDGK